MTLRKINIEGWDNSWLRTLHRHIQEKAGLPIDAPAEDPVAPEALRDLCACGCGETSSGWASRYLPGHDQRVLNRPGHVYAMRPTVGGPVKLGHAENLLQRLTQEQRWAGELEIIWSVPVVNVIEAERLLHAQFAALRYPGAEWFDLPEDLDPGVLTDLVKDLFPPAR